MKSLLIISICVSIVFGGYALIHFILDALCNLTTKLLERFGIVSCLCGRKMKFTATEKGRIIKGYFGCKCGLKESGYQLPGKKPKR